MPAPVGRRHARPDPHHVHRSSLLPQSVQQPRPRFFAPPRSKFRNAALSPPCLSIRQNHPAKQPAMPVPKSSKKPEYLLLGPYIINRLQKYPPNRPFPNRQNSRQSHPRSLYDCEIQGPPVSLKREPPNETTRQSRFPCPLPPLAQCRRRRRRLCCHEHHRHPLPWLP